MKKMGIDDNKWHSDFINLAWESGFSFGKYQYPNIDKYRICLVDIDRIIRERDVASVENQIPTILQYNLDNDQANVLDSNFVKVFRMSQLAVEYLLFCKKYLDDLVISMRKEINNLKQEKKDWTSYIEQLETQLSAAATNNLISTFKCDKCPKVFSSMDYLTSHIKRRHIEENIIMNSETDKLHNEIRELRDRLIVAEKNMMEKADEPESEKLREEESCYSKFIDEIHKNFGKFKEQVEIKIEQLQSDKDFFNAKYDKLFDALLQCKDKENEQYATKKQAENEYIVESTGEIVFVEHSTQTDDIEKLITSLDIQTIDSVNSMPIKENIFANRKQPIEDQMNVFGRNTEYEISNGLINLQIQMKTFCEKLMQLEANQNNSFKHESSCKMQSFAIDENDNKKENKPKIKPRTKFSKPTILERTVVDVIKTEKLKSELNELLSKKAFESCPKFVKSKSTSESDSETIPINVHKKVPGVEEVHSKSTKIKSEGSTIEKNKSNANMTPAQMKKRKEQVKKGLIDTLHTRLQEMGISPSWHGIPKKTFERISDIIRHQANLNKKYFSDYDKLRTSIENSLRVENKLRTKRKLIHANHKMSNKQPSVIKIGYRKKIKKQSKSEEITQPLVAIRNRSLYDTDSEIERLEKNLHSMGIDNVHKSVIVQEAEDTDSNLKLSEFSDENKLETRSMMKTYPSDFSLVKKKVLFDMEKFDSIDSGQVIEKGESVKDTESCVSDLEMS